MVSPTLVRYLAKGKAGTIGVTVLQNALTEHQGFKETQQ